MVVVRVITWEVSEKKRQNERDEGMSLLITGGELEGRGQERE